MQHLVIGLHAVQRQCRIDARQCLARRGSDGQRVAVGDHNIGFIQRRCLRHADVHGLRRRLVPPGVVCVLCNPNDGHPRVEAAAQPAHPDLVPDRVFTGEIASHEFAAHHGHRQRIQRVALGETAPGNDRNVNRGKVSLAHQHVKGALELAGHHRAVLNLAIVQPGTVAVG